MINSLLKSKKNPKVFLTFRGQEFSLKAKKFYAFPEDACFHIQINNMNLPYDLENIYKLKIQTKEDLKFSPKVLKEEVLIFPLSYDENGLFEILFIYEKFGENELLSTIFSFSQAQEFCSFYKKEDFNELLQSFDDKVKKEFLQKLKKQDFKLSF